MMFGRTQLLRIIAALTMAPVLAQAAPLYPNSVVSNDLEFISTKDASVFACMAYDGTTRAEMPDKRNDELFVDGVHQFALKFQDGTAVTAFVHPKIGSKSSAQKYVSKVAKPLGRLPTFMRARLGHVIIHKGDETAFSEDEGRFFVLYSRNIDKRIKTHDLEETIFHETVHATLDVPHAKSRAWRKAARADGDFVTGYAARNPDGEDMAESALFAWAVLTHPGRLPDRVETKVRQVMPHRLAFFKDLFPAKDRIFQRVGPKPDC